MITFKKKNKDIDKNSIKQFQDILGSGLPADYEMFLTEINGRIPESNSFKGTGEVSVRYFYAFPDEILSDIRYMEKRIPKNQIPIATDEFDNLFLLSLTDGSVYFWDHEQHDAYDEVPYNSHPIKIARSFNEFLENLEPWKPEITEVKGEVIYEDPDFTPEFVGGTREKKSSDEDEEN